MRLIALFTVMGKDVESSLEPLRTAHLDYTLKGLRSNIRYVRKDVEEMGRAAVAAEEEAKAGKDVRVPRYAAYSIWVSISCMLDMVYQD